MFLKDEKVLELEVERLKTFKNHPFKVIDDEQMQQLKQSIEQYGILNPIIVRPQTEGCYEIISGHRRKHAAEMIGYRKVPVIIKSMSDEEAILFMIDANVQREQISPSEKAFSYKLKYEVIKKLNKAGRSRDGYFGKKSVTLLGEAEGISAKQVQRYIKITELIPEFLEKLDTGQMSFNPAYELAFLKKEQQKIVLEVIKATQSMPSVSQAQRIKELSKNMNFSFDTVEEILSEVKKGDIKRVEFKNEQIKQYFPKEYTITMMKKKIIVLLKQWNKSGQK